ncbi:MAG TPA: regulatory iron-sulfur-containing complex subunit RicT [Dissulfurispiraceae bacterium]|nr:regulatory iron-sulfur-containing complex subunit RicT [Dissulfurispiraceae bacterium]
MSDVVSIRFKACGKIYDFASDGIELAEGDLVVVESDFGLNIAKVVRRLPPEASTDRELKHVLRSATAEDLQQREQNKELEREARLYCNERIMARGLPMKLIATESTLDKKRVVFYFTAEGRIDFRELVKDLAAKFKTRIEMRQIGVRDEAKLVGGLGACGRELCCKTFLTTFEPISIRMAKKQEMVLNVGKLSGLCSRLMCCLRYEYDMKGHPAETAESAGEPENEPPAAPVRGTAEAHQPPPEKRDRREEKRLPALPALAAEPVLKEPEDAAPEPQDDGAGEESPVAAAAEQTDESKQRGRRRPRRRRRTKK